MRFVLSIAVGIALARFLAASQTASGTINVVVEDSSQAVMPAASVTVTNKGTGLTRTGNTGPREEFTATFLPAGNYAITVQSSGFKRATLNSFTLQVDQNATVHVTLLPGDVIETVQVTESTPLLEADTSSLGQVIENKKILDLPLNGRNPFALGLLAGNTTPVTGMATNLPFIAGGGRFSSNEVLLDGVDNNTTVTAGAIGRNGIAIQPSVDAVQEFNAVETALRAGCTDLAAIEHLLRADDLTRPACEPVDVGMLAHYYRPLPVMTEYDQLLAAGCGQ